MRAGVSGRLFFDLRSCAPAVEQALHWTQVQVRRANSRLEEVLIGVAIKQSKFE